MGTFAGEPLDAEGMSARELAEAFIARSRLRARLVALAGVAVTIGCLFGFGYFSDRQNAIGKNGVHTTATVTSAALYGGRYSPNSFNEHIDVEFTSAAGLSHARIYIGEQDVFRVGQQVNVVYDPAHPNRAVLASGYHDIGPVGFPLFFGLVFGVIALALGLKRVRLDHRARRALRGQARTMEASASLVPSGRARRLSITLRGEPGEVATLWSSSRRGWSGPSGPVEATVFGSTAPGSVVVVVDPERGAVTAGRVWRPLRLPHLPRIPHAFVPALLAVVVGAGLAATVVAALWAVRLVNGWQESDRIQAGPRVLATVVATGGVEGARQDVTLRYTDLAGAQHFLPVRYPLGIGGGGAIPGMSTTVGYDPKAPEKAELAGHPRHDWQNALLAVAATLGLTVFWLAIAASLRRARDETGAHRGRVDRAP